MGLSPIMTDVSLIFCKIQMCPAELQPNYKLHLLQIASFSLDFAVVKTAVKFISRKLLKYSFLITVKVWFVQYSEILTLFLFYSWARTCWRCCDWAWVDFLSAVSFAAHTPWSSFLNVSFHESSEYSCLCPSTESCRSDLRSDWMKK